MKSLPDNLQIFCLPYIDKYVVCIVDSEGKPIKGYAPDSPEQWLAFADMEVLEEFIKQHKDADEHAALIEKVLRPRNVSEESDVHPDTDDKFVEELICECEVCQNGGDCWEDEEEIDSYDADLLNQVKKEKGRPIS